MSCQQMSYCPKCDNIWPPRAHHCSVCKWCVLWMDHHCPWVGNCVGYDNIKFFLAFVWWAAVGTGSEAVTYITFYWNWIDDIWYIYVPCAMFSLALMISLSALYIYQFVNFINSVTTLEIDNFSKENNPFDLGVWKNLCLVLGSDFYCWLLPTRP